MDNKITIKSHRCEECQDYTEAKIDGRVVLSGDYYHDKIDEQIEGFAKGLRYMGKEVIIEEYEDFICEYCEMEGE